MATTHGLTLAVGAYVLSCSALANDHAREIEAIHSQHGK
jgi:hypothetical protein